MSMGDASIGSFDSLRNANDFLIEIPEIHRNPMLWNMMAVFVYRLPIQRWFIAEHLRRYGGRSAFRHQFHQRLTRLQMSFDFFGRHVAVRLDDRGIGGNDGLRAERGRWSGDGCDGGLFLGRKLFFALFWLNGGWRSGGEGNGDAGRLEDWRNYGNGGWGSDVVLSSKKYIKLLL